jgi:hypothetical protein
MKNLIIIIILTFTLSSNAQILLKDEDVFGNNYQTPVINSPNYVWMIINTFNPKIGDNEHQKAYLLNKNGEKKNEFIGAVFLGFSLDSKTVIVRDLINESVKELSIPDLKIVGELSFKSKAFRLLSNVCLWYLPQKNKLIVAKEVRNSDRYGDKSISLELWDWQSKKNIQRIINVPFLQDIMQINDGQISNDDGIILLNIADAKDEVVKYRAIILETSMLKIISTVDLTPLDVEKHNEVIFHLKLSEKGDRLLSHNYVTFDQSERTYNQENYIWDSMSGKLLKTLKFVNNAVEKFYVNENNEIITLGHFNMYNTASGGMEIIRKWDSTLSKTINTHRESTSIITENSMSNNGDIYFWNKQSKILTPFNIKTWSKGKFIKL